MNLDWEPAKVCEHLRACVDENGLARDGEPYRCDSKPCNECGALCPGSIWDREIEMQEEDRERAELEASFARNRDRAKLHKEWLRRDGGA